MISSHILGELEKIATHYGIIRQGKMIREISAAEMESQAKVVVSLRTQDMQNAERLLKTEFLQVKSEDGYINVYNEGEVERIVEFLMKKGHAVSEVKKNKIGLEEYYVQLMSEEI